MEAIYMLCTLAMGFVIVGALWIFFGWFFNRKLPRIKLFEFFKLYKVNEEAWILVEDFVEYKYRHRFSFNLLDYIVYRIWYICHEHVKRKNKNKEVYLDFRHAAKEDFEKIERDKK